MNYTFYTFLKELQQGHRDSTSLLIEIPYIQRDYVQGRKWKDPDALAKRDEFVMALFTALLKDERPLIIDFIYGYIDPNNSFVPLDGQQRLTTLFLLHWILNYTYKRIHQDDAEKYNEQSKLLSEFGYVTRISSQQFCVNLAQQPILLSDDDENKDVYELLKQIDAVIQNQSWFAANSKFDPTVQAMLQMLVAMGECLGKEPFRGKIDEMLETLYFIPKEDEPARGIVFDKLDIHDLHQTDELYIKMNARGKQLTPFENWKSEFCDMLSKHYDREYKPGSSYRVYFSNQIEHDWTDFFWTYAVDSYLKEIEEAKNGGTKKVNEISMPTIDTYFSNYYQYLNSIYFYTEKASPKADFKSASSREKMEVFCQKQEYVDFVFASLDWLHKIGDNVKLKRFWDDLFYSGTGKLTDKVKIFDAKDTDLYLLDGIFYGRSLSLKPQLLVYALLRYCVDNQCVVVNDDLKRCMRECRNYLEDQLQYLTRVEVSSDMRNEYVNKYKEELEKIISCHNGLANPYTEEEKIDNQIEDWDVLAGHQSVFDEIFKDGTIAKRDAQEAILDLFCKNQDLPLARLLVAYGYPGCLSDDKQNYEKRFWGSDGTRWNVVFLPNPNRPSDCASAQKVMHNIIRDYIAYKNANGNAPTMDVLENLQMQKLPTLGTIPADETPVEFRQMMLKYVFINMPATEKDNEWRSWKYPLIVAKENGKIEWLNLILAGNYKKFGVAKHADPFAQFVVSKMKTIAPKKRLNAAKSRGNGKEPLTLLDKNSQVILTMLGTANGWHVKYTDPSKPEIDLLDSPAKDRVQTAIDFLSNLP